MMVEEGRKLLIAINFVRGACAFGGLGHRGDGVRDHSR